MNKLTALVEAAKAATPWPWIAGRVEVTGSSDHREPYSPWIIGAGPHPVTVGRDTCIHADDMAFIALANPSTVLELCTLLQKAEEVLDYQIGWGRHYGGQDGQSEKAEETLTAIKQWKGQT